MLTPEQKQIVDVIADGIVKDIVNLSKCAKMNIEGGMPGHSDWIPIQQSLNQIYIALKEAAEENIEENTEVAEKAFDSSSSDLVMSSKKDSTGGLFVGEKKKEEYKPGTMKPNPKEKCPICGKMGSEETISQCDNSKCPYDWLQMVETKE